MCSAIKIKGTRLETKKKKFVGLDAFLFKLGCVKFTGLSVVKPVTIQGKKLAFFHSVLEKKKNLIAGRGCASVHFVHEFISTIFSVLRASRQWISSFSAEKL